MKMYNCLNYDFRDLFDFYDVLRKISIALFIKLTILSILLITTV